MDIWRHIYWISFLFYTAVLLKRGCKLNNVKARLFQLLSNDGHDLNFIAIESLDFVAYSLEFKTYIQKLSSL